MSKIKPEVDCTTRCRSRSHGQAITSAITKRSVEDKALAAFIKGVCANFIKAFDFEGRTALHMAASRGRVDLMEWLVKHSSEAFINARDRESGSTSLHRSVFYGQIHAAVALMKIGVNTDIVDKDDYTALEHALLDRTYMFKHDSTQPCDAYVWGTNTNYTLGTGSNQPRNAPDMLAAFSRANISVKQVCLGKFHSVWLCSGADSDVVWCCGQLARAGAPHSTALRPTPLRLAEPCTALAITLNSTVLLLDSGLVLQYTLNSTDNVSQSCTKTPNTIRLPSIKPVMKLSNALGVRAGRSHAVVWNKNAVYTWGTNLGQLGHSQEDKMVPAPKRVAITINSKEEAGIQLVEASDAATVLTTSRGDVYLLHKYICKKIAIKQINLRQVCVECKVSEQGACSRVTVLLLTCVGQLLLWQDTTNKLTRCVFGLAHQVLLTHAALTHDAVYFTTKHGEAYSGTISRKAPPTTPAQPIKKERDKDGRSALVKFLEKDDCSSVKITKIPNIHRAVSIAVDNEGLNFACLQTKPTCGLRSVPELSPSSMCKHMDCVREMAAEDDLLHDVVFQVGNRRFPAHMFIIASSSEYLYKLYQDQIKCPGQKPTITIDNVHPEAFERVLKYVYTGTCDVVEVGPCGLKIRREDMVGRKDKDGDGEVEEVENPSEVSAFEVHKAQEVAKNKKGGRNRRNTDTPPRTHMYCDPVKLVQASARRLQVKTLHKLLEKFYHRDGKIYLKEHADHQRTPNSWSREAFPELVDTNVCSKDGMLVPAHKCVLAARLDYFNGMFMHSWTESKKLSKVTLPINYGILLPVINFLYTDTCPEVENSESIDFICNMLIVADQLFITRLRAMCEVSLANLITLKNCTELCQFAHTYNATQLKQFCMEFISLNLTTVLENRCLDALERDLLEDITNRYCKFNPILSSRVITPFYNAPNDETIEEYANSYPVDLGTIDEEVKRDDSTIDVTKKKSSRQKKIDYTDSEKERMRYESVSSVTSLDLSNEISGDITLSLSKIKDEKGSKDKQEKWIEVPSSQKQQKVVQARLKAISSARDILNEPPRTPTASFTKLTHNSSTINIPSSPGTRMSVCPQNLSDYLGRMNVDSPPEKPKNPWKVCEAPVASSSPKAKAMQFDQILTDQKKQKNNHSRIMTKPLAWIQLEDKAIEQLGKFYNAHEADDELITVRRIELQISSPKWNHTAPK